MSDRPPQNPDDLSLGGLVDEVVSQVRVALDEAEITSRHSRELLLDGLKDVFESMDPGAFIRPRETDASAPSPDVTVVDGGRAADAPPTDGPRPDLKVAEPDSADEEPESSASTGPSAAPEPKVVTRVTVRDLGSRGARDPRPRIQLAASADDADWRSLFRGSVARPYRISVTAGTVRVSLDGLPADTVHSGASLDVEAKVIQVAAMNGEAADLRYERLSH